MEIFGNRCGGSSESGIGGEDVHVEQTVELSLSSSTLLHGLVVVSQSSSGVIERVDEEERGGSSSSSRRQITGHPHGVTVLGLSVGEEGFVVILEGEVEGLSREVSDDVGGVSSPD